MCSIGSSEMFSRENLCLYLAHVSYNRKRKFRNTEFYDRKEVKFLLYFYIVKNTVKNQIIKVYSQQ